MAHQGLLELMLFFAMVIGAWLASIELLFPKQTKTQTDPTADNEDDG